MPFSILCISILPLLLTAASLQKDHAGVKASLAFFQRSGKSGAGVFVQHGLIAAKQNLSGNFSWAGACKACDQLEENGFNDWHLPDKDELNKLYLSRTLIGGFPEKKYWSSTEYDQTSALSQHWRAILMPSLSKNFFRHIGRKGSHSTVSPAPPPYSSWYGRETRNRSGVGMIWFDPVYRLLLRTRKHLVSDLCPLKRGCTVMLPPYRSG